MNSGDEPVHLRDALEAVGDELGLPSPDALRAVLAVWPDLVGIDVAGHARPVTLRDGLLTIAVDDPAWSTRVRYLEGELVRAVAPRLGPGAVRAVRVRVERPGTRC
jgi:predicted nucleic acid-binding Zn ribbon protein